MPKTSKHFVIFRYAPSQSAARTRTDAGGPRATSSRRCRADAKSFVHSLCAPTWRVNFPHHLRAPPLRTTFARHLFTPFFQAACVHNPCASPLASPTPRGYKPCTVPHRTRFTRAPHYLELNASGNDSRGSDPRGSDTDGRPRPQARRQAANTQATGRRKRRGGGAAKVRRPKCRTCDAGPRAGY